MPRRDLRRRGRRPATKTTRKKTTTRQVTADCNHNHRGDCAAFSPALCVCNRRKHDDATTADELRRALANLRRFDAIVTLEHFRDPLLAAWLATLLFRDRPPAAALRQLTFTPDAVSRKDNGGHKPRAPGAPPELAAELERRNAHDRVLYDYARRRVTRTLACFGNSSRTYAAATSCFADTRDDGLGDYALPAI